MTRVFCCPIYWTNAKKTKKSTTHLIGMNLFRNAHFHVQHKLKKFIESILHEQCSEENVIPMATFTVEYQVYYKNPSCDASNVVALMEKFFLDFAQEAGLVTQDSVKVHLGSSWVVGGQDKENPRCEITLRERPKEH